MNRIVLIGNGFDLAHGLNTRYEDFINWYWERRVDGFVGNTTCISQDPLCKFEIIDPSNCWNIFAFQLPRVFQRIPGKDVVQSIIKDTERFNSKFYTFFDKIIKSIETKGWVDIENEYYSLLAQQALPLIGNLQRIDPKVLNFQLNYLKTILIDYLKSEAKKGVDVIPSIKDKIYRPIKIKELAVANLNYSGSRYSKDFAPNNIMLLSFNYTKTEQQYVDSTSKVQVNHIHGCLDDANSVIFGYGDELDSDFEKLKNLNDNECLRNIKSIRYLETDNYRKMLEFIESGPFQVCIMGHSCGNSDRTLLNTLFEHRFCVSVKPYFYKKDDGTDNYLDLVQNISRNFTDMKLMRDRVVNKTYCEPLSK